MLEIDYGSKGTEATHYFAFQQLPSQCGKVPAESFYIKLKGPGQIKTPVDVSNGFLIDITDLSIGWSSKEGSEWKIAQNLNSLPEYPGNNWQWGFIATVALKTFDGMMAATWMNAGPSAKDTIRFLNPQLTDQQGQVPVVKVTKIGVGQSAKGVWRYPELTVVKWGPKPDCLNPSTPTIDFGDEVNSSLSPKNGAATVSSFHHTSAVAAPTVPPASPEITNDQDFF